MERDWRVEWKSSRSGRVWVNGWKSHGFILREDGSYHFDSWLDRKEYHTLVTFLKKFN